MAKTMKDELIKMQQDGYPIIIGFAGIGLQVFKIDSGLERALWDMDMRLGKEDNDYYLIDINDTFGVEPLDMYKLNDGIYVDLKKRLD